MGVPLVGTETDTYAYTPQTERERDRGTHTHANTNIATHTPTHTHREEENNPSKRSGSAKVDGVVSLFQRFSRYRARRGAQSAPR
jgi:hypothetical protein